MDNKRSYKKLATFFWTSITFLPFIFALFLLLGEVFKDLVFESTDYVAFEMFLNNYWRTYVDSFWSNSFFECFTFSMFDDLFTDLFTHDIIAVVSEDYYISTILAYMVSIQFIHLIFDVIVWLPNLFHKWLNKERF